MSNYKTAAASMYPLVRKQVEALTAEAQAIYDMVNQQVQVAVTGERDTVVTADLFDVMEKCNTRNWLTTNEKNATKMVKMLERTTDEYNKRLKAVSERIITKALAEYERNAPRRAYESEMRIVVQTIKQVAAVAAAEQCTNASYEVKFEKGIKGSASPYYNSYKPEYYYYANVVFSTGITIYVSLTEEGVITDEQVEKAKAEHQAEFAGTYAALAHPNYRYARYKGAYCTIYGQDDYSPSGIHSLGGASSMAAIDYICRLLKKRSDIFSPTEMLASAAIGR